MAKLLPVRSPQFRVSLIRKLANLAPGCAVEFVEGVSPGIGFRLKDSRGRYRSNVVRIYRNGPRVLEAAEISRSIRGAGMPPGGFPNGLHSG